MGLGFVLDDGHLLDHLSHHLVRHLPDDLLGHLLDHFLDGLVRHLGRGGQGVAEVTLTLTLTRKP